MFTTHKEEISSYLYICSRLFLYAIITIKIVLGLGLKNLF